MAPLSEAIRTAYGYTQHNETRVYTGEVDTEWVIGSVAHGGAVISCCVDAAWQHQSHSHPHHPDPAHLSAQFLTASSGGPFEVHIKPVSVSSRWTRLDVSFYQPRPAPHPPHLRVRVHMIFTSLPPLALPISPSPTSMTLLPHTPSPLASQCPLRFSPSECVDTGVFSVFKSSKRLLMAERRDMLEPGYDHGLRWGSWTELTDEAEDLTQNPAMIAFFADLFRNGPELLPKGERPGKSWFPTITMTVEFKAKWPLLPTPLSPSEKGSLAPRTVGIFSTTKWIQDGRHDDTVEVWSAPSTIGTGQPAVTPGSDEWRKTSQILAVSTQVGLTVPFDVNTRKGAPGRL